MTILHSASPSARAAGRAPHGDRLRVIMAGRVGDMSAQLGTSGFEVVAVAETEDALIDAVSVDEPDAIVVEDDLCVSLEHVRDLAPDAVLIVVGDRTPAGALGRIERGVSGTVMAGLLHALVGEGVGAAVLWGLVPVLRPPAALHGPQHMNGSLLSAKVDLVRAHLANALRGHAGLVGAASAVAVTVSAGLLLTLSAPSTHEPPKQAPLPAPNVERAGEGPIVAASPTTQAPAPGLSASKGEPGDRRAPNRAASTEHGRQNDPPSDHGSAQGGPSAPATSDASHPPGVANGWDRRPPKRADDGHHTGWSDNSVPKDLPPAGGSQGDRKSADERSPRSDRHPAPHTSGKSKAQPGSPGRPLR